MKTFFLLTFICYSTITFAQFSDPFFITYNVRPHDFDLADIDGDGDQDVLMSSTEDARKLVWYENMDNIGNTWEPHTIATSTDVWNFQRVRTLDVDNDGDIDFLADQLGLFLFRNNGDSNNIVFTKEEIKGNFSSLFFEVTDLDNDNVLELVTGNYSKISRFNNIDGLGTFEEEILVNNMNQNRPIDDVQIVDLDADGDKDIVVGRSKEGENNENQIGWFRNENGQTEFSDFIVLEYNLHNSFGCTPVCNISTQLIVANFSNDSLPDIIYLDEENPNIIFQLPNHNFSSPNEIATHFQIGDLLAMDMDDDGDMDFVAGNQNGFIRHWYKNIEGFGTFEEVTLDTMDETYGFNYIRTADVEDDGDQDLFFYSTYGNSRGIDGIYMIRNEGGGNFANHIFVTDNINGYHTSIPNDLDEDEDIDILFFAKDEGNIYWSENKNMGDTLAVPKLLIENGDIDYFRTADLDNDNDLDIIVKSELGELAWYQLLDTTPNYSDKILIDDFDGIFKNFEIGDLDNDGWKDIVGRYSLQEKIHFYKNQGNGNFADPEIILIPELDELITLADINVDGLLDIIYENENRDILIAFQDVAGSFSTLQVSNLESFQSFLEAIPVDIDNDGDLDIFGRVFDNYQYFLLGFINEGNTFVEHTIFDPIPSGFTAFNIADLDGDGKKDLYFPEGFYRQLYTPTLFSSEITQNSVLTGNEYNPTHADLDNDGDLDIIHGSWQDGLVWKKNQLNEGYWIEGQVFLDDDENCEYNVTTDSLLSVWLVEIEKDNEKFYVSTNSQGFYNAFVPDTGEYIVNLVKPSIYWGSCVQDTAIQVVDSIITTTLDIPVLILQECPLLSVNVGSTLMRPCIDGTVSVRYCNNGTIPAEDAQLEIVPDSFLIINSSNIPWTSTTDSSYIFDIGNVGVEDCGSIRLYVTPDCDSVMVGDVLCTNAYITPDSICSDSLWDGSTIEAFGTCNGDSIHFELENIGSNPMSEARQFKIQIVNDDIVMLIFLDTFFLDVGETKSITINTQQADALYLEAEQDPDHPVANTASQLITNCNLPSATNLNNLVLNFPDEDGNPFSDTHCQEVTGSYDPNIKEAFPKGVGDENIIERDWEIDYTIHFQNTGNDTAFIVIIKDPISTQLDLSTLRVNGASHDFKWELNLNRELIFIFENILLVDSTTNESASHGYVQFSIKPNSNISFGTEIKNLAAIYFDFNEPIITNETKHKIRIPVYGYSDHFELCEGNMDYGFTIETDTILIDTFSISNGYHVQFTHLDVLYNSVTKIDTIFNVGDIFMGMPIMQDTTFEEVFTAINGCDSIVYTQVSLLTDLDELANFEKIKVYPNPTQQQFFIDWKNQNHQPIQLEIYDANGEIFKRFNKNYFEQFLSSNKIKFNIIDWITGVYILKIKTSSKTFYKKLVIIK